MRQPRVAVIILNWNGYKDTIECLESLQKITYPNYEIIVVDNASSNNSVPIIKGKFPSIQMIENNDNYGFAEGNNIGIRYALKRKADYVLLLNNDTIVDKKALSIMVETAESDSKIGIVGALNYYYSWSDKICYSGSIINWWSGNFSFVIIDKEKKYQDVDKVAGSAFLIKERAIKKIGLLVKKYFCYFEESDFCFRAKKTGYKVVLASKAKVFHKISSSADSNVTAYFFTRNKPLFLARNSPKICLTTSIPFYCFGTLGRVLIRFLNGESENAISIMRGFFDFISHRYGKGYLDKICGQETKRKEK